MSEWTNGGEECIPNRICIICKRHEQLCGRKNCHGVDGESGDDAFLNVNLFLLMYADDTVLLDTKKDHLQCTLNSYQEYCENGH